MSGLAALERAAGELQAARERVHEQVLVAVAGGASWAEVGRVLGVGAAAARRQHQPVLGPKPAPVARVRLVRGWACASAASVRVGRRAAAVTATWPSSSAAAGAASVPAPRPAPARARDALAPTAPRRVGGTTTTARARRLGGLRRAALTLVRRVLGRLRR